MIRPIRFHQPFLAGGEQAALAEVIGSGRFSGNGPFTQKCQSFLAQRYGVPHVLLTHSCTAALEICALLLDIKPGDEVIIPSYTFCSTASAFLRVGATIKFCEMDPQTLNLDIADVLAKVGSRTRAIVPVHYAGVGVDMETLRAGLGGRDILLIEDAAQALEGQIDGKPLGTLGQLGCFSFHESKNLHCGLGGALFLNDAGFFERAENIWERGTNRTKMFRGLVDKYSWVDEGSSFYPTELQAAFLWVQLQAIDRNREERKVLFDRYRQRLRYLESASQFRLQLIAGQCQPNFHALAAICDSQAENDALRVHFSKVDIQAYIGYVPLHSSVMGRKLGYRPEDLPVTESYAGRALRLPLHNDMSESDVDRVCDELERFYLDR